ncbi:MAG TPA: DNA-formamidopyrimidine glycosylase [Gammaproteobacteria bacterium]|nr:DNA-formamidopyrimidine glycosylase [Gammaproteobacteria bacterium]
MPELPEVETTCRGIKPHICDQKISAITAREARLRWPFELPPSLIGQPIIDVRRRAKYILIQIPEGQIIIHLGMSGSLRLVNPDVPPKRHDHIDVQLSSGLVLRYNDPRRFGSFHFQPTGDETHWLLRDLGVEPLGNEFSGDYLFRLSRRRRVAVKIFIMNANIVVGVGNIYAAEALFTAGIRPGTQAHRVTRKAYDRLAEAIRAILSRAIDMGGTTLRDFVNSDGQPGYFKQSLKVYGREGLPCRNCGATLRKQNLGQRSTVFCPQCQRYSGWR